MASSLQADSELERLKMAVQRKFVELRAALHMREKLLLRQVDVIATTQQQIGCSGATGVPTPTEENERGEEVKFLTEQEDDLLTAIRSFGRFQLGNMQLALQDVYLKQEDYIAPANDHETMYKCLQTEEEPATAVDTQNGQSETIVVDFSKSKSFVEHSRKHMNESIINITLQEAKELIRKAKIKRETPIPPLNLEEMDDELESSIAEAMSSLGREQNVGDTAMGNTKSSQTCVEPTGKAKAKKGRFKPKITINNCNGTINLRNISSLTINCASEEAVNAELQTPLHLRRQGTDSKKLVSSNDDKISSTAAPTTVVTVESTSTGNSTPTTTASSSNYSSNASSRSQSKKQKNNNSKKLQQQNGSKKYNRTSTTNTTTGSSQQPTSSSSAAYTYPYEVADDDDGDEATTAVTCDFYNRLLNEIKNSLKQQQQHKPKHCTDEMAKTTAISQPCDINSNSTSTNTTAECTTQAPAAGRRLVLKNFENLKIVLESNNDEESAHPVQIEQWLAEIISETDLEPMQNTEILEHSKIKNSTENK